MVYVYLFFPCIAKWIWVFCNVLFLNVLRASAFSRFHDTEVVVVGGVVSGMLACVYVSVYVPWILQQAHLVAMCQCHWPLCSPSGWYTHSARNDSCSIRGPSRTTDTQTFPHTQSMTHNQNANSSAQSNKRIVVHTSDSNTPSSFAYLNPILVLLIHFKITLNTDFLFDANWKICVYNVLFHSVGQRKSAW